MYEGAGQARSDDIDACPNCGYLVVSLSIREQAVPSGDVLWVEALKCLFCDAKWEEWD